MSNGYFSLPSFGNICFDHVYCQLLIEVKDCGRDCVKEGSKDCGRRAQLAVCGKRHNWATNKGFLLVAQLHLFRPLTFVPLQSEKDKKVLHIY